MRLAKMNSSATYDIAIVGAGPAGCTCALALKNAGLKVALIDKRTFPRDKVCGDAIPSRAIKTLHSLHPRYAASFQQFPDKCITSHTKLFYKNHELQLDWVLDAYTSPRFDFDHFLFSLVASETETEVLNPITPSAITSATDHVLLETEEGGSIKARLVIGADGAHSFTAKQLAPRTIDRRHYIGSVRAYFSDIADTSDNMVEMYFHQNYLPSYFWIFPVHSGRTNVGFGMVSSEIVKRNIDLKKTFYEFIAHTPALKARFNRAKQESPLQGFGLPLGSRRTVISGNNFMLTGDAASLIDPFHGEGIGNAMLSGKLAAGQAIRCFHDNRFDAVYMKQYDKDLWGILGSEMKKNYFMQRLLFKMPFLLGPLFSAGKNQRLKRVFRKLL